MKKKLILLPLLLLVLGACGSSVTPSSSSEEPTSSEPVSSEIAEDTNEYRIVGSMGDPAWTPDSDEFLMVKTTGENIFTVDSIDLFVNDEWAITINGDWAGQLGFQGSTDLTIVDEDETQGIGGGFDVKNFKTLTDGNYEIELNTGVSPRVLTITRLGDPINVPVVETNTDEWHLVGTMNNWTVANLDYSLVEDAETANLYSGEFDLEMPTEGNIMFKVITATDTTYAYARGSAHVDAPDPLPAWLDLTSDSAITIKEAGTYKIDFTWVASEGATINGSITIEQIPEVEFFGTELFFSEYIEGPSFNKVLELYNPTSETVDLSHYTVKMFSNGKAIDVPAPDPAVKVLEGTLGPKETFVFHAPLPPESSSMTDTSIIAAVEAVPEAHRWVGSYNSSAVAPDYKSTQIYNFNGDDSIGLFKDGVLIDVFGLIGLSGVDVGLNDPGSSWTCTFANGETDTQDVVLTRIPTVSAPSVNSMDYIIGDATEATTFINAFNPLEWSFVEYTEVTATHTVGTHVMTGPVA